MARNYQSFLHAYRDYIVRQESPPIFHLWIALTMISGVLKRNVWIDRNAYKIYPNLYTILVADSAECKKSVAMETGLELMLQDKSIMAVHEQTTPEGLTDVMNRVAPSPSGKIRPDGSVFLHADELTNLFNKKKYTEGLITFLTAAYTAKARLDFVTRGKGRIEVRNPCPVILAGTTPNQFGKIFPIDSIELGFHGRMLIVTGHKVKRIAEPVIKRDMQEALVEDLLDMADLEGEMVLTPECRETFIEWYESGKIGDSPCPELAPYYQRKHDHILKCAMLLSVSESNDRIVTEDHFWTAVELVESLEPGMAKVIEQVGSREESQSNEFVYQILQKFGEPMGHSVLFRRIHRRVRNATEFAEIIESLIQQEKIEVISNKRGIQYKCKEVQDDVQYPTSKHPGSNEK